MTKALDLSVLVRNGGRIRVSDEYVVSAIDMSELTYFIESHRNQVPKAFSVKGKEATVKLYFVEAEADGEGEIEFWRYESVDKVTTKDGDRKVSITVYND